MPKKLADIIVLRAYELWQANGEPQGRDEEFYLQAERELREAAERGDPPEDAPEQ